MIFVTGTLQGEMPAAFWEYFDGKRQALGWSDRQVATKAGISNSVISKARTGEQPIKYEALIKIALAFDDPPEMILRLADLIPQKKSYRPEADEWASLIDNEDPDTVRAWIAAIRAMKQSRKAERRGAKG